MACDVVALFSNVFPEKRRQYADDFLDIFFRKGGSLVDGFETVVDEVIVLLKFDGRVDLGENLRKRENENGLDEHLPVQQSAEFVADIKRVCEHRIRRILFYTRR